MAALCANAQTQIRSTLSLMTPGNPAKTYELQTTDDGSLKHIEDLPVSIKQSIDTKGEKTTVSVEIKASEDIYFNISQQYVLNSANHSECEFYMPGFWYHKNLRSPKEAPSFHTSDSWEVREDRLSTPLTGIYNPKDKSYCTIMHTGIGSDDCIPQNLSGDIALPGKTSVGSTGFRNENGKASIVFSFPYIEAPKRYIRKLTLIDPVKAFEMLKKGESCSLTWEIINSKADSYSEFVAKVWEYSYDTMKPQKVMGTLDNANAKATLAKYFTGSYVDTHELKYFSGCAIRCITADPVGTAEVGFVGRTLLNAYNALEYGESNGRDDLVKMARNIFDSYLEHGFSANGFFRDVIDYDNNWENETYSIRRQSEGVMAILYYLQYEKQHKRKHPEWEAKIKGVLDNFAKLQQADGSFPRKFNDKLEIKDPTGGSTPCATLPLTMAYKYFGTKSYLESAKRTAVYFNKELVATADYFSSTLDADCEDKEASLYGATALYYLTQVTKGKEREHYIDVMKTVAYFALSWYYTWDVPFAPSQMLGDLQFKSRGWGNVSVENNHIDVYIFEFATILDFLSQERSEPRFADFSSVIKSSMLQLMPVSGRMCGIGREGFYPEVVQHTTWDYGRNGKGFYNDIFAPGWTVASLWNMLSPSRVTDYFSKK